MAVALDRRLHAVAQVTMARLEALFVDEKEALEVVGQGPVEHRALGTARVVDPGTRRDCNRLHPEEGRRNRAFRTGLCAAPGAGQGTAPRGLADRPRGGGRGRGVRDRCQHANQTLPRELHHRGSPRELTGSCGDGRGQVGVRTWYSTRRNRRSTTVRRRRGSWVTEGTTTRRPNRVKRRHP